MLPRNPLLRTYIAEHCPLLFIVSAHACFLTPLPLQGQSQTRFPTDFFRSLTVARPRMPNQPLGPTAMSSFYTGFPLQKFCGEILVKRSGDDRTQERPPGKYQERLLGQLFIFWNPDDLVKERNREKQRPDTQLNVGLGI